MKTLLTLLCTFALLGGGGIPDANASTSALDDAHSFVIARSVKLGDSPSGKHGAKSTGTKQVDFSTCRQSTDCSNGQKCDKGKCVPV